MTVRRPSGPRAPLRPLCAAMAVAFMFAVTQAQAQAEEDSAESGNRDRIAELLEKLKEKGLITEADLQALSKDTPEERTRKRAERRKQAKKDAEEAAQAEAQKEQFTGKFNNGISFETPDRRSAVSIGGRLQTDYRNFQDQTAATTFDVRRAFITLQGKWNEYLTWDISGDFANFVNNSHLEVAWMNAVYNDALQFRFGQFSMPFSLEEQTSDRFLDFPERSLVNQFVPQKERGAMVHGSPYRGLYYGLAASTGQGKNNADVVTPRSSNDINGKLGLNIAEMLDQQSKAIYYVAGMVSDGDLPTGFGLTERTEARGLTFFNTANFTGQDVHRRRSGVETVLAYGPVKFQGEYVLNNFQGTSSANVPYDRDIKAYYAEVMWMITGERYAESFRNGVFGRIVPIRDYTPGQTERWGAWELGLRYSSFNGTDFNSHNPVGTGVLPTNIATNATGLGSNPASNIAFAATPTNKADSVALGLKWIWNPNLRLYLTYVQTKFDTPVAVNLNSGGAAKFTINKERALLFRVGFDF